MINSCAEQQSAQSNGSTGQGETQASPNPGLSRNSSRISRNFFKKRDEMTDRQQREANLGTILVCISLLFILCQSIKIIPDVSTVASHTDITQLYILSNKISLKIKINK